MKCQRCPKQATLHITGRDVPDKEIVLRFDPDTLTWISLGSKDAHVRGVLQAKVLEYLRQRNGVAVFPKVIAEAIGSQQETVRTICARLADERRMLRREGSAFAYPGDEAPKEDPFP